MDELQSFGYRFLGPIITSFFDEIEKKKTGNELFFLAREGYHLESLYKYYCGLLGKSYETKYLLCSRVFLFKLCLTDKNLIPLTLGHHFKGSLESLLIRRYGFSGTQINKVKKDLKNSDKLLATEISLPSRQDIAVKAIFDVSRLFINELESKKKLYLKYLDSIGFNSDNKSVVDIGFSGTIQKLLSKITNKKTIGHYMVTTVNAKNSAECTFHGHFSSGQKFGNGYPLLDKSLYLESLLTAPHGQVNDIFGSDDGYRFGYSTKTKAQHEFYLIDQVVEGIRSYMDDTLESGLQLTKEYVPEYFASIVKRPQFIPEGLRNILEVDDHISGFGVLNPIKVFG
ncbi:hypothetical protein [Oceaniserpentilla sp. 4NH20-0058]|uniref:hypothetical protein n=1 Tax=Oceaniserpentilla sp. 4NH20-0058 TaxID=3127660 RepID=UPI0033423FF8